MGGASLDIFFFSAGPHHLESLTHPNIRPPSQEEKIQACVGCRQGSRLQNEDESLEREREERALREHTSENCCGSECKTAWSRGNRKKMHASICIKKVCTAFNLSIGSRERRHCSGAIVSQGKARGCTSGGRVLRALGGLDRCTRHKRTFSIAKTFRLHSFTAVWWQHADSHPHGRNLCAAGDKSSALTPFSRMTWTFHPSIAAATPAMMIMSRTMALSRPSLRPQPLFAIPVGEPPLLPGARGCTRQLPQI